VGDSGIAALAGEFLLLFSRNNHLRGLRRSLIRQCRLREDFVCHALAASVENIFVVRHVAFRKTLKFITPLFY